ncbi:hypothetical protein VE04_06278, partial [Pseudogymnoascus sp. 24MN13]
MASTTTSSTPSTNTVVHSPRLALDHSIHPPPAELHQNLHNNQRNPSNLSFTQCHPQGWDEVVPESRFHFSPAVCPDQWTAYYLKDVNVDIQTPSLSRRATTAPCCASGYNLDNPGVTIQGLGNQELACISAIGVKAISSTAIATATASETKTPHPFPYGVQIHKAYQISWDETDKPTLSPTPPDFSIFKTSLVAVPAFIRVLPVTTSGPVTALIMKSTLPLLLMADGLQHATPIVVQPRDFAKAKQLSTYGVRPDAAMPI